MVLPKNRPVNDINSKNSVEFPVSMPKSHLSRNVK